MSAPAVAPQRQPGPAGAAPPALRVAVAARQTTVATTNQIANGAECSARTNCTAANSRKSTQCTPTSNRPHGH
eukprot:2748442-Prorocentrum_lima.AAC.1